MRQLVRSFLVDMNRGAFNFDSFKLHPNINVGEMSEPDGKMVKGVCTGKRGNVTLSFDLVIG